MNVWLTASVVGWIVIGSDFVAEAVVAAPQPRILVLGDRHARIAWETLSVQVGRLRWYKDGDTSARVVSDQVSRRHRVTLDGLAPGAAYWYQVAEGKQWSTPVRFQTFAREFRQPLRFAVIGDSGSGSSHQWAVARRLDAWRPDFVLHVGDVIYEDGAEGAYGSRYVAPYARMIARVPVYPVLGNHDCRTGRGAPLLRFFGLDGQAMGPSRWYERRMGGVQLLACDSNVALHAGSAQYQWLESRLAVAGARWRIVYFHHPLYSGGMHGGSDSLRRHLQPLFDRYRVQLVFQGHDHHYERSQPLRAGTPHPAGTTYIVTGGAGAWLRPVKPMQFTARALSAYHFVGATLEGERLSGSVFDEDGLMMDTFSVSRDGGADVGWVGFKGNDGVLGAYGGM
jgi:hypothetical protein